MGLRSKVEVTICHAWQGKLGKRPAEKDSLSVCDMCGLRLELEYAEAIGKDETLICH